MAMRYVVLFLLLLIPHSSAQEVPVPEKPGLGYYGHGHDTLHAHGVIKELLRRTGSNCCDSGVGGECRVTQMWQNPENKKWMALLDGMQCPVSVEPITDIPFPSGVFAVVCASKTDPDPKKRVCPKTHCAANVPAT